MEEILHHLPWKIPVTNGINYQPTSTGERRISSINSMFQFPRGSELNLDLQNFHLKLLSLSSPPKKRSLFRCLSKSRWIIGGNTYCYLIKNGFSRETKKTHNNPTIQVRSVHISWGKLWWPNRLSVISNGGWIRKGIPPPKCPSKTFPKTNRLAGKSTIPWRCISYWNMGDFPASHVSFQGCHERPPGGPFSKAFEDFWQRWPVAPGDVWWKKKRWRRNFCLKETVDGSEIWAPHQLIWIIFMNLIYRVLSISGGYSRISEPSTGVCHVKPEGWVTPER